jgi:hypothetical protein
MDTSLQQREVSPFGGGLAHHAHSVIHSPCALS